MGSFVGITGANGVLGRLFQEKFKKGKIKFSCFSGDIRSKEDINDWIKDKRFTDIIHLAAIVSTKDVKENIKEASDVNVLGTKNLIQALIQNNQTPWFFYASSSHIYKSKNSPISEEDIAEPISEYGKTKYAGEKQVIENYSNFCIGRIFSFYHRTQKIPFLYPTILERLEKEDLSKPFKLFGAESMRDFLNAEEVVNIIIKLMKNEKIGVYNIASGKGIKIKDFVQSLTDIKLNIEEIGERDYLVANISKLNKALKR